VHSFAAAFGLSAILATSAQAFLVVKLAGAAYLAYLGIRMLLERTAEAGGDPRFERESPWAIYRAGLLTNMLNPKVALFFMAFLPQFVSASAESRVLAFLFLGAVFIVNGTLWCLVLVLSASAISARLRGRASAGVALKRAAGAVFVGLGVRLAVSK
jgi:threonine/homoserine/homoserine lactone efflux protein